MWFSLSDAIVKFQNAYLSLIHLSESCLPLANAAVRHRVRAQGGCTVWLPSFLTPRMGKSYSLPFPDRRTGLFWGLPRITAASCDVNNRWRENLCPVRREYSVVWFFCCTETLAVCWKHASSNLQFGGKKKSLIRRNKSSHSSQSSSWR